MKAPPSAITTKPFFSGFLWAGRNFPHLREGSFGMRLFDVTVRRDGGSTHIALFDLIPELYSDVTGVQRVGYITSDLNK